MYYTGVSLPGDPLRSYRENLTYWFPLHVYYLGIHMSYFCILVFPAICSRSVELQCISVTFKSDRLTLPNYRVYSFKLKDKHFFI